MTHIIHQNKTRQLTNKIHHNIYKIFQIINHHLNQNMIIHLIAKIFIIWSLTEICQTLQILNQYYSDQKLIYAKNYKQKFLLLAVHKVSINGDSSLCKSNKSIKKMLVCALSSTVFLK